MLRQDGHEINSEEREEGSRVGKLGAYFHCLGVYRLRARIIRPDIFYPWPWNSLLNHAIQAEYHIVGRHRLAVGPVGVVPDMESNAKAVIRPFPTASQITNDSLLIGGIV
jgi:hypothetical protein